MRKLLTYLLALLALPALAADPVQGTDYSTDGNTVVLLTPTAVVHFLDNAGVTTGMWSGKTDFQLGADIDLTKQGYVTYDWTPTELKAMLDGKGHKLTYHDRPLFTNIAAGAGLKNIDLTNTEITVKNADFTAVTGGVCKENNGTISNCDFNGYLIIFDQKALSGQKVYIGGIAGVNKGTIESCSVFNQTNISTLATTVCDGFYVGSIAGRSEGTIKDCFIQSFDTYTWERDGDASASTYADQKLVVVAGAPTDVASRTVHVGAAAGELVASSTFDGVVTWDGIGNRIQKTQGESFVIYSDATGTTTSDWNRLAANIDGGNSTPWRTNDESVLRHFSRPQDWSFATPAGTPVRYPVPTMKDNAVQASVPDDKAQPITLDVQSNDALVGLFNTLADPNLSIYADAVVNLPERLTFDEVDLGDLSKLTLQQAQEAVTTLPQVKEFSGTLNGGVIENLCVGTAGLFGKLASGAKVQGLVLENATLVYDLNECESDDKNVYLPIVARELADGAELVAGFMGNLAVVDATAKKAQEDAGKALQLCMVDRLGERATLNAYVLLDEIAPVADGDSKACITIKQNLGTGRNKPGGGQQKVATQKQQPANKALPIDGYVKASDANNLVREFDLDAFQDGAVAYWLNYDGVGYTGTYKPRWSQGNRQPVPALATNSASGSSYNAVYKVNYQTNNAPLIAKAPAYANNGTLMTITYTEKPTSVVNGSTQVTLGDTKASFKYDANSPVEVNFTKAATQTALTPAEAPLRELLQVNGRTVSLPGVAGVKGLYTLRGVKVDETTGATLSAANPGAYIVVVGKHSTVIRIR